MNTHRLKAQALGLAASLTLAAVAGAQVRSPGEPMSNRIVLPGNVPVVSVETPDVARYKAEDEANQHRPFRYGAVIPTALASDFAGRWDVLADEGVHVWRIGVTSPGAYTLGIVFDIYRLPGGAQVFLYTPDKRSVLGAYTADNVNPNGQLAIEPVAGDTVIVEYVVPEELVDEAPPLQIGQVIHDYRNVFDPRLFEVADGGDEGAPCLVDINCPQGANYQDVKRAVVRTFASGALCSGAIITNATKDGTAYMLTANHCGNMTNAVLTFNYENTTCGGGGASTSQTVSGCTKLAASSTYDSQLYLVNANIPASYKAFYAGWDRSTTAPGPVVSIGHGGGGPKQIATDNNGASTSGTDWQLFWHSGILIGGNSGGPLFNNQKRVIGPACCVSSFSCGNQFAFFGKFGGFYSALNLGQWLDPQGTNPMFVDGFDPNANCGATVSYGQGCPGTWLITPTLAMSGCFSPSKQVSLDIQLGLGAAQALLFFGLNQAALPMGGGCTLNVSPLLPITVGPLPLSGGFPGQGAFHMDTILPSNASAGTFTLQAFIIDPGAPAGFSNTNGQQVTIQP